MNIKLTYKTDEDRSQIIAKQEAVGLRLQEDYIGLDIKWLKFTDEEPIVITTASRRNLEAEIDAIKSRLDKIDTPEAIAK